MVVYAWFALFLRSFPLSVYKAEALFWTKTPLFTFSERDVSTLKFLDH